MLGPAAFHQMLSNALLNIRCRRPIYDPSDNYESIKHHGIAVRIVKEGMSDPAVATSDAFIGAIVGLTCYHVRIHACRNMNFCNKTGLKIVYSVTLATMMRGGYT